MWLRVDRVKQPLEVPYSGAHEVVSFNHELKTAQTKVNGLSQIVSIQKLEPCKLPLADKKSHQPNINAKESPIKSNVATKLTFQERYCLCNEPYNGARLKYFNKNFLIKRFPLDCVGLRAHPKDSRFCSTCKSTLTDKHVRIESEKMGSNWTIWPLCWQSCSFLQILCNIVTLPNFFFDRLFNYISSPRLSEI